MDGRYIIMAETLFNCFSRKLKSCVDHSICYFYQHNFIDIQLRKMCSYTLNYCIGLDLDKYVSCDTTKCVFSLLVLFYMIFTGIEVLRFL